MRRSEACGPQTRAIRVSEIDMVDTAVGARKEGRRAAMGVVDDLVRHGDHARREVGPDAAHRRNRDYVFYSLRMQRPNVRPVIDLMGRYRVTVTVTREENHFAAVYPAESESARRLAIRRTDYLSSRHLQVG